MNLSVLPNGENALMRRNLTLVVDYWFGEPSRFSDGFFSILYLCCSTLSFIVSLSGFLSLRNLRYPAGAWLQQLLSMQRCTSGFGGWQGYFSGENMWKRKVWVTGLDWSFVYVLLFVLPTVLMPVSLVTSVSYIKVLGFTCLFAITVYSLANWSKCSTVTKKSWFGTSFKP